MWPYSWTHVGTPSHLGHMDRVAATMPSQAQAGAAQEAPNIGQWEGQDVPLVRPSSCTVKGGIPSSRRYLPTYLPPCRRPPGTRIATCPPCVGAHGTCGWPRHAVPSSSTILMASAAFSVISSPNVYTNPCPLCPCVVGARVNAALVNCARTLLASCPPPGSSPPH